MKEKRLKFNFHSKSPSTALFSRVVPLAALFFFGEAASSDAGPSTNTIPDLSLEQLMAIEITSVSKKEENPFNAPAAISVLSNEEIRRSGATSVAEALRLVPGLEVAQVNSSQWAISSRGFNEVYANKLLVLVDGRAVYNPLFGGVFWDLQQTMLDDVDRIEVIRGPGATLWGANAMNGVINVVTRSARDTQGLLAYGGGGDVHQALGGARYGGQIDDHTYYRVFGDYQLADSFKQPNGTSANDNWQGGQGGFRLDHYPHEDTHMTWQGDVTVSDLEDHSADAYNVNTLGRWTHQLSEESSLEGQVYYDRTCRNEPERTRAALDTADISLQHSFSVGRHNDFIWGLGYRFIENHITQTSPAAMVLQNEFGLNLVSAFVQDEIKVVPDKFTVSIGTKLEHNDISGFEYEPGIRASFKPSDNQTVWAAVSRAVRTPSETEGMNVFDLVIGPPFTGPGGGQYVPVLVGNPDLESEVLIAYEAGYRIKPAKWITGDIAGYYNDYSRETGIGNPTVFVPGSPGMAEFPWKNMGNAHLWGGEVSVTVSPVDSWRLTAAYSLLQEDVRDSLNGSTRVDPQNQVKLRSSYDFTRKLSADAQLRYVDSFYGVPAYVTADVRLAWRPVDHLEVSLVGQNLFQDRHIEQGPIPLVMEAEVPRGFYGKIALQF